MNSVRDAASTLVRLLRRDGWSFFGKCFRFGFSREAWRWLLSGGRRGGESAAAGVIRASEWFDADWYRRTYPDVARAGLDPAVHYARCGRNPLLNPGPDFVGDEYLALNPEAGCMGVHPLLHFERHGKREGRLISFLENDEPPVFPEGAVAARRTFRTAPAEKRRTAVFAGYFGNGRIPETDLFYLRGLREIADNVVYVCNNPVFPDELGKVDGIVCAAFFEVHGEYDFGSYKRGWFFAKENGLLDPAVCDEAVFANNSCYGPVYPFSEAFSRMADEPCDFWGLASDPFRGRDNLQSFFFVFRRPVLDGTELDAFLRGVARQPARGYVVMRYELGLTRRLADAGYRVSSFLPADFRARHGFVPSRMPVTTMGAYRFPLLKAKVVNGDSNESVDEALAILARDNPGLHALVRVRKGTMKRTHRRISAEEHRASFPGKIEAIRRERVGRRLPVRVLFLVASASEFPARPLFESMLRDPAFDARIFVVPDLRRTDRAPETVRRACRSDLGASIPDDLFLEAEPDEFGLWPDVIGDFGADIVCYPSLQDLSRFRFNPHWALGRKFLPIHVGGGSSPARGGREATPERSLSCFWETFPASGAALAGLRHVLGIEGK